MKKAAWVLVMVVIAVVAFVVGFLVGPFGDALRLVFFGLEPSRVCIDNSSGHNLENVVISARRDRQVIPALASGTRTYIQPRPKDSAELTVEFTCDGQRRRAAAAIIGPRGEHRTITILEDGKQVIISYGTSDGLVRLSPTEKAPLPLSP